ncbi:MAG: PASTA domain-containing protein, partial [Eubacteriales bacterium]
FGANEVVSQDPEANAIRLKSENGKLIPVTLYVNMGEEEMEMPDCTLIFLTDAKKLIRSEVNALTVNELSADAIQVVEEYHDTYPAEYVIRTEPAAGALVKLSDDLQFTIYVSKGQKISNTVVPDLEGMKLADAKQAILSSKLALGKIYYEESDTVGAGLVMKASHSKGETVAQGITAVDLWVSIGSSKPALSEPSDTAGNAGNQPAVPSLPDNTGETVTEKPAADNLPSAGASGENPDSDRSETQIPSSETVGTDTPQDIAGLLDMRNAEGGDE